MKSNPERPMRQLSIKERSALTGYKWLADVGGLVATIGGLVAIADSDPKFRAAGIIVFGLGVAALGKGISRGGRIRDYAMGETPEEIQRDDPGLLQSLEAPFEAVRDVLEDRQPEPPQSQSPRRGLRFFRR